MNDPSSIGSTLLHIARLSIEQGARTGSMAPPPTDNALATHRASFVTLHLDARLRGCIGNLQATRPLAEDVHVNAYQAGFRDPRFAPLTASETGRLDVSVSVLSKMTPLAFRSETMLLSSLAPGQDGLLIRAGQRQATFLPSVWSQLDDPREFLDALKRKAGFAAEFTGYEALRYRCEHYAS